MSRRWPAGSELLPVSGWLSTSAMMSNSSGSMRSTGVSAIFSVSTMARFCARPTIPPCASVTVAPISFSSRYPRPSAAASASGSGLSCA
jgi:hypothetical protein